MISITPAISTRNGISRVHTLSTSGFGEPALHVGLFAIVRSPGALFCGEASCNRPCVKSQTEGGLLLGAEMRGLNHAVPAVSAAFL